jgi:hypothetical protein
VLGSHVALPCQVDPTFAAYSYSLRALRAARRSSLGAPPMDGLRRIVSSLAGCVLPARRELDHFILLECFSRTSSIARTKTPPNLESRPNAWRGGAATPGPLARWLCP